MEYGKRHRTGANQRWKSCRPFGIHLKAALDRANKAALASNPVLAGSFHTPDRFGWLEFVE